MRSPLCSDRASVAQGVFRRTAGVPRAAALSGGQRGYQINHVVLGENSRASLGALLCPPEAC
eukprot:3279477-Pyramimonas_sp.AAC.1